jgi:hypothetical protein
MLNLFSLLTRSLVALRYRCSVIRLSGSHDDVVAELSTFGIGSNLLTVDPRSEESTMVIREWFAARRLKESARASSNASPGADVVSQIGHYDVLFGKCAILPLV